MKNVIILLMVYDTNGRQTVNTRMTDILTVQQGYTAELDLNSVQLYDAADTTFSNPLSRNEYTFHYTSHVKMITGSHDIDDPDFTADFKPIHVGHHCWIGTGATILQGVNIGDPSTSTPRSISHAVSMS